MSGDETDTLDAALGGASARSSDDASVPVIVDDAPARERALTAGEDGHLVSFYDGDDYYCEVVGRYLEAGASAGDRMLLVVTREHAAALRARLASRGVDVAELFASGLLIVRDAQESLARFVVGDTPDWARFDAFVTELSGDLGGRRLRIFGEMVDLLWRAGRRQAAIRLEEMWNQLAAKHSFTLLCAYRLGDLYREGDGRDFHELCLAHSHVLPRPGIMTKDGLDARFRDYARLREHARRLEDEIEQRKKLEEELREALRQRRQAEHALRRSNAELDRFAYIASHDLKAPLRAIGNLSQWIEDDQGEHMTAESRELMGLLRGRVRRMEALIDGILMFARAGKDGQPRESVDVGELVREVVDLLQPQAPAEVVIGPGMPVLETERVLMYQVFQNLIGNALKHAERADVRVMVGVADDGAAWHFTVADNGRGIEAKYHERIFAAFTTLQPRDVREGTGIGLSVAQKIVGQRGGRIWVESQGLEAGGGATFHVLWPKLPLAQRSDDDVREDETILG